MAIARLTVVDWDKDHARETETLNPSWPEVESAIRALNARNRNDVYLQSADSNTETYLCIGGGAGKYIASGAVNNERFPTWVLPEEPAEPTVKVVVGGQPGDYPNNWILDLDSSLRAARSFFDAVVFTNVLRCLDA